MVSPKGLDVLVINTYGGSLLLGAKSARVPIRGSYEDCGFGTEIQKHNFPSLDYIDHVTKWPRQNLAQTVVIAHPPCSAFSRQNHSAPAMGVDSPAFRCTVKVMRYGMENRAPAILIESVTGALEGARELHDALAKEYGYDVFRVVENAVTFGLPQWRPRVWFVFTRRGATNVKGRFTFTHVPRFQFVRDVLDVNDPGPVDDSLGRDFDRLRANLKKNAGYSPSKIDKLLTGGLGYGFVPWVVAEEKGRLACGSKSPKWPKLREICQWSHDLCPFESPWYRILSPDSCANVLMGNSHWISEGRQLGLNEYKAVMGFPREYVFPDKFFRHTRMYLSKGVCPPIATWVLQQTIANLTDQVKWNERWSIELESGETADYRIQKKEYEFAGKQRVSDFDSVADRRAQEVAVE